MRYDMAIVGAGVVGLVTALMLRRKGYSVVLVDQKEASLESLSARITKESIHEAVSALNARSIAFFQDLGVWDEVVRVKTPGVYAQMQVRFSEYSDVLTFSKEAYGLSHLGMVVHNQAMLKALSEALLREEGVVFYQGTPKSWDEALGRLEVGECIFEVEMLLGADGAHSWVRRASGIAHSKDELGQGAWVFQIQHRNMHRDCARQSFTQLGVIGLLPLEDPYRSVCIWSCKDVEQDKVAAFIEKGALDTYFPELGACQVVSKPLYLPIHSGQAARFASDRTLLLGDAAVSVHPLAGLGLNMGLRGVRCLSDALNRYRIHHRQLGTLGEAYSASMESHASLTRHFILGCVYVASSSTVGRRMGALGFSALQGFPWLKRRFVQHAVLGA